MSTFETRNRIKSIERIDLERASYIGVQSAIRGLLERKIVILMNSTPVDYVLFRARKNIPQPTTKSEFLAPPSHLVSGYQRCNPPEKPMFYCSSSYITTFFELQAEVGDIFFVSRWIVKSGFAYVDFMRDHRVRKLGKINDVLHDWVKLQFTKPIPPQFDCSYKITSAITEKMITGTLKDPHVFPRTSSV